MPVVFLLVAVNIQAQDENVNRPRQDATSRSASSTSVSATAGAAHGASKLDQVLIDSAGAQDAASQEPQKQQPEPEWNCGGFVDVGYLLDFNHPANDSYRSRGTALLTFGLMFTFDH